MRGAITSVFHRYLTPLYTCIGVACTLYTTISLLARYRTRQCRKARVSEVLVFPDDGASLDRMIGYLLSAKHQLDVCQYLVTCHRLADALRQLHARGVSVQVLVDGSMSQCSGSQTPRLSAAGLPICLARTSNSGALMHHKFAVVDGRLVLNGSFNWTRQASCGNHENVLVTDEPRIVRQFVCEFQRLWQMYSV